MRIANHEATMQFKHVTLDIDGPVAVLKMDHQEVMNAVSMDMLGGLAEALDVIEEKKSDVRCVVLTGAGRAFCKGATSRSRGEAMRAPRSRSPSIRSCDACAICIARWSPPSTARPPARG
jgi:2-(1,2-epoxy-1,2-dihydrophenyl)acetyl-CoA isomerase